MKLKKLVCGMMALAMSGATVYATPVDFAKGPQHTKPAVQDKTPGYVPGQNVGPETPGFKPVQPVKPGIPVKPETLPEGVKLTKDQATAMVQAFMPKASTHVETKLVDGKGKHHYEVTYTYKMMELVSIVDANAEQIVKISAEDTTFVGMKVKNLFHKNPNYTPIVTVKEAEAQAVSLLKDSKVKEATQLGEFNLLWAYRVVVENADMTVQVIVDTETKAVKAVYAYPKLTIEQPEIEGLLTEEEVKAIITSLPQYKKVTITAIKLVQEDGKYIYEVEGVDGKFKYDFEVDAKTGKILDVDKEKLEDEQPEVERLLTEEEIIAIINKMPQYKKVTIIDMELDKEDGKYVYEVEGVDDKFEYDFEVDAKTGKILEVDKEKLDDDHDDEEWDD